MSGRLPWALWWTQTLAILRLEMRKNFAGKRAVPVYLLAAAPVLLFGAHAVLSPNCEHCDPGRTGIVYAGVFQLFVLRLAIFFGCVAIFMNLFRGDMLDKTLHFWFLAPIRREVLLLGKYLAGLVAAVVIFTGGALLCFAAMLWPHDPGEVQVYWQAAGLAHAFWYGAAAALGCVGYGSVFLAAGLLLRNPIVPAATLLLWEAINGFLPATLQKVSVLYYLQSLCPIPAPMDNGAPAIIRMLLSPAEPASHFWSVAGLLALTALVLVVAARASRRIEISYSTEKPGTSGIHKEARLAQQQSAHKSDWRQRDCHGRRSAWNWLVQSRSSFCSSPVLAVFDGERSLLSPGSSRKS